MTNTTETADRRALDRIRQMADAWEQRLPEVIRTPAVVSAIRAALELAEGPRRVAAEEQPAETQDGAEAHPAEHTWAAELHDPLADEWVPGTRYLVRDRAVNALAHAKRLGPTWKDGTPTERRLVRATTTYTVEAVVERPAVVEQPDTQTREARRCPAKHGALGRICKLPLGHPGMHTGSGPNGGAVWDGDAP